MSNPVPLCTHVKANGVTCGSPAVSGTALCYHHSALKAALGKVVPLEHVAYGAFMPIPFVFPEDRASLQINYFLLLQAFNEQRIELREFKAMMTMLRGMATNLGKSGSLAEETSEPRSAASDEESSDQGSEHRAQENSEQEGSGQETSDPRSAVRDRETSDQRSAVRDRETSDQRSAVSDQETNDVQFEVAVDFAPAVS